jgi:hypothetical protein
LRRRNRIPPRIIILDEYTPQILVIAVQFVVKNVPMDIHPTAPRVLSDAQRPL